MRGGALARPARAGLGPHGLTEASAVRGQVLRGEAAPAGHSSPRDAGVAAAARVPCPHAFSSRRRSEALVRGRLPKREGITECREPRARGRGGGAARARSPPLAPTARARAGPSFHHGPSRRPCPAVGSHPVRYSRGRRRGPRLGRIRVHGPAGARGAGARGRLGRFRAAGALILPACAGSRCLSAFAPPDFSALAPRSSDEF